VHDKVGVPLLVTDDDIAGTFTFLRTLMDNGFDPELSAEAMGDGWLNYLIEGKTCAVVGRSGKFHRAYGLFALEKRRESASQWFCSIEFPSRYPSRSERRFSLMAGPWCRRVILIKRQGSPSAQPW
jgi:hypothetical protein